MQLGASRAIGYFLEGILCLALFAKAPISITFTGITNDETDPSVRAFHTNSWQLKHCFQVDIIRTVTLPMFKKFGVEDGIELKVALFICRMHLILT